MNGIKRAGVLSIVGLVFGVGMYRLAAEPIKVPLLPVPVSQPMGEPPAKGDVTPAGGAQPVIPKLPTIPPPAASAPNQAPVEVAPPARSTQPMIPALPRLPVPSRQPDFNLQPPASGLNVNPSATVPMVPAQPAPGETPMPKKQLLLSAMLGAALAAGPAPAPAAPVVPPPAPVAPPVSSATPVTLTKGGGGTGGTEQKEDVAAQLKQIKDDLKELQRSLKTISDAVNGTKDGAAGVDSGLLKRVASLESSFTVIDSALKRIESKLNEQKSTSAFGPSTPTPMPSAKAYVRVVNEYPTDMSLLINGKSHRLKAGEVKTVEVAAGSYTYELLHSGAQQNTSSVKDGETVTLRIR